MRAMLKTCCMQCNFYIIFRRKLNRDAGVSCHFDCVLLPQFTELSIRTDRQTDNLVQTVETWPNREEEKNIRSHKLRQSPGDWSGNCELLIYTWYNLLNYDLHNYLWKATRYQLPALHRHHRLRVLPQLQQFVFLWT